MCDSVALCCNTASQPIQEVHLALKASRPGAKNQVDQNLSSDAALDVALGALPKNVEVGSNG